MSDRRYNDQEIAAIFRLAAEGLPAPPQHVSREQGLTVADLRANARGATRSDGSLRQWTNGNLQVLLERS